MPKINLTEQLRKQLEAARKGKIVNREQGYQGAVTGRIVSPEPSFQEIPGPHEYEIDYAWIEVAVLKRLGVNIEYLGGRWPRL